MINDIICYIKDLFTKYDYIDEVYEDHRENKDERGVIAECFYCNSEMRVDADYTSEDYDTYDEYVICNNCSDAQLRDMRYY